ncbi:MAG TPA: VWA domain-containing protein [Anaerolineales bacterium]
MTIPQDFYTILGLTRNASAEEIRRAYFEASRRLHPDTNTAPGDTEFFLDVQQAYEVLSNPKKRSKYNLSLPPEKPADTPLEYRAIFSRPSLVRLAEPQLIYVYLEFSPPANLQAPAAPALNLCLVLDRSTSMQGANMDVVKSTALQIMRKMKPKDIFSVVAFSDKAEEIIPASRSADLSKQEARIHMLQPSGGTEIFSGLEMGYNEIIRNVNYAKINHIILLTDGRTYGDEEKCMSLAHRASEQGVGISGLGIGSEWNDNFLDNLASCTGGSSMYVSRPQDIQKTLLDKFNQLGNAYAEETRIEFKIPDGIELRYAFRLQPEAGVLSYESPMILGPVVRQASLRVLMEFVVQPQNALQNSVTLFDGKVSVTLMDERSPASTIPIHLDRPIDDRASTDVPPTEIVEALSYLKLYRLQEEARLMVTAGEYDQASEHLHRLATHLLSKGERNLARTALLEAENIQQNKSFSQQGGKEIKYGTRALLTSGKGSKDS